MDSKINMTIQLSPPRKPRAKKKNPADSKTMIIDTLLKNKATKNMLVEMFNEHKELINEYEAKNKARAAATTPIGKLVKTVTYESPTAYLRRRALKQNHQRDFDGSWLENMKNSKPAKVKNQLLHDVLAFIEINDELQQLETIKATLKSLGGAVANKIGKGVTHVIFKDGRYETYKAAKHFKVFLVCPLWLDVISSSGIRVPEIKFPALHAPTASCESICEKLKGRRSLSANPISRSSNTSRRRTMMPSYTLTLNDDDLLGVDIIPDSQPSTPSDSESIRKSKADLTNFNDITLNLNAKDSDKQSNRTLYDDSPLRSAGRVTRRSSWIRNTLSNPTNEQPKSTRRLLRSSSVNSTLYNDNCNKENQLHGKELVSHKKSAVSTSTTILTPTNDVKTSKNKSTDLPKANSSKLSLNSPKKAMNSVSLRTRQSVQAPPVNCDIPEDVENSQIDMEMTKNVGMLNEPTTRNKHRATTYAPVDMELTSEKVIDKPVNSTEENATQLNVDKQHTDDKIANVTDKTTSKRSSTSTVRSSASVELVSYLPRRFSIRLKELETKNSSNSCTLSLEMSSSQAEGTNTSFPKAGSDCGSFTNMSLRLSDNTENETEKAIHTSVERKSDEEVPKKQSCLINEPAHPLNANLTRLIDNFQSIIVNSGTNDIHLPGTSKEETIPKAAKGKRKLYNPDEVLHEENDDEERRLRRLKEQAMNLQEIERPSGLIINTLITPRKQKRELRTPSKPAMKVLMQASDTSDNESFVELTQCVRSQNVATPKKTQTQQTGSTSLKKKQYIACTRLNSELYAQFKRIVHKLGGFVIEPNVTSKTTHLVTSDCSLTMNLLRALCQGIWIIKLDWVYESDKNGKWKEEEFYELTTFSPLIQQNRLRRQNFGKAFCHDVFVDCGSIYLADVTRPSKKNLHDMILLCKGTIVDEMSEAKYLIGVPANQANESQMCLMSSWVIDCIVAGRIKKPKQYRMLDSL